MIPFFLYCARHSGGRQSFKTMCKAIQARGRQLPEDSNKEEKYFLTATNMIYN